MLSFSLLDYIKERSKGLFIIISFFILLFLTYFFAQIPPSENTKELEICSYVIAILMFMIGYIIFFKDEGIYNEKLTQDISELH